MSKTMLEIRSGKPISEITIKKIKQIFEESKCPNESMRNSIEDFAFYNGFVVQLNSGEYYKAYIEL